MKKKILGTALILVALVGFNMSAQEPSTTAAKTCTENTNCPKANKDKAQKKGHKHHGSKENDCKGDKGQRPNPFEGITLTAEQQAQLDSICPRKGCKTEKCDKGAVCDKAKADQPQGECKGDCKNCDKKGTKDCVNAKAGNKDGKAKGKNKDFKGHKNHGMNPAQKAEFMEKVKGILTPEQYEIFLKNVEKMPAKGDKCAAGKCDKGGKDGKCADAKGGKCNSGNCDKANCGKGNCSKGKSADGKGCAGGKCSKNASK